MVMPAAGGESEDALEDSDYYALLGLGPVAFKAELAFEGGTYVAHYLMIAFTDEVEFGCCLQV